MDLGYAENSYLIEQFSQSAASLGFSKNDVDRLGSALNFLFNLRGAPPISLIPASAGPQLQAMCLAPDCPLYPVPDLQAYPNDGVAPAPAVANKTLVGNATVKSTETMTPTPTANLDHYGCIHGRDIVDGAAASACSGTITASATETAAATTSSTSGAKRSVQGVWLDLLAAVVTLFIV